MELCASCAFWPVAHPSQGHETLFDASAAVSQHSAAAHRCKLGVAR
jgi:hypothetical protein